MDQLGKWEELLQYNKEMKFFNFGEEGNISMLDKHELTTVKDSEMHNYKFSILLMLHQNKFYKIINESVINENLNFKVDHFVHLLQTYENYPVDCTSLYIDTNLLNKNFFNFHIEEIIKFSY